MGSLSKLKNRDQLIRFVQAVPTPKVMTPRVLGIDDWAIRKGQTYGTILVDLEKQQVIDLLPDRQPETVAAWLIAHPGIEIISRDRGKEFIEGIALGGGSEVIEIADRFHLLKNMVEMLQRLFEHSPNVLKLAAKQNTCATAVESPLPAALLPQTAAIVPAKPDKKTYRQTRFDEVKQLVEQGFSQRAIAGQLGLARQTVHKYLFSETLPRKNQNMPSCSKAAPYLGFIRDHWDPQHPSVTKLLEEVQAQGFTGSYASLRRVIHSQLGVEDLKSARIKAPNPLKYSPRQAAWAIFRPESELKATQKALLRALSEISPTAVKARQLAHAFREMIEERQKDRLDQWLLQAESSQIVEFERFAAGLRKDYKAVRAALTYSWSNGQVEGQVNRLKVIKRQMYGRASFSLLRRKVLGMSLVSS